MPLQRLAHELGWIGLPAGVAMTGLAPSVHGPLVCLCALALLRLSRRQSR